MSFWLLRATFLQFLGSPTLDFWNSFIGPLWSLRLELLLASRFICTTADSSRGLYDVFISLPQLLPLEKSQDCTLVLKFVLTQPSQKHDPRSVIARPCIACSTSFKNRRYAGDNICLPSCFFKGIHFGSQKRVLAYTNNSQYFCFLAHGIQSLF